ncbi:MAG: MaoC family dehydratase N-terminal domain-containing protein [Burkholderiales bacterium]|nr:MaoC family dehydratase N-terminal domain-containing protein [Burkholderiales bacterium]
MKNGQLTFNDVAVGTAPPTWSLGPWTTSHIARYCAATENWERQHYDYIYATRHDRLPNVMANGGWRKYVLSRLLKDWAGIDGWIWKLHTRYTQIHFPDDTFQVWARVLRKFEADGMGIVEMEAGMRNQRGEETTPARAMVALPLRRGEAVRLPFVPPAGIDFESTFRKPKTTNEPKHVTAEVEAMIGHETDEVEAADAVSASELRRIAQAIPDMDPLYWNEAYARGTRHKGIVAPALFPVDGFRQPPHLPDRLTEKLLEDPDFQGGPPWDRRLLVDIPLKTPLTSNINGGQEFEVFDLARLGERLRASRRIADIYETESAKFGRAVYRIEDVTYKNAAGRVILTGRIALIYR